MAGATSSVTVRPMRRCGSLATAPVTRSTSTPITRPPSAGSSRLHRPRPQGGRKTAAGADCGQPGTQRRHPGLGQRPRHRAQRPRAHPRRRGRAVPRRHRGTV